MWPLSAAHLKSVASQACNELVLMSVTFFFEGVTEKSTQRVESVMLARADSALGLPLSCTVSLPAVVTVN